jgi:hypothetical protein
MLKILNAERTRLIANSTFSWWGRGCRKIPVKWLSRLDLKIVRKRYGGALMGCCLIGGLNFNDRH